MAAFYQKPPGSFNFNWLPQYKTIIFCIVTIQNIIVKLSFQSLLPSTILSPFKYAVIVERISVRRVVTLCAYRLVVSISGWVIAVLGRLHVWQ